MQNSKHSSDQSDVVSKGRGNCISLQIEKFSASNGWLEAFQCQNNINFRALCGESANVDKEAADDWKRHLAAVVEGYAIEDQLNTD